MSAYVHAELVKRIVDGFPPLTDEQRAKLAILLRADAPKTKRRGADVAAA